MEKFVNIKQYSGGRVVQEERWWGSDRSREFGTRWMCAGTDFESSENQTAASAIYLGKETKWREMAYLIRIFFHPRMLLFLAPSAVISLASISRAGCHVENQNLP